MAWLIGLFVIVGAWFAYRLQSIQGGLIFSAGAFLTFGARAELLQNLSLIDQNLSLIDHVFYIGSAFLGIALIALFITVMANVLLKDN